MDARARISFNVFWSEAGGTSLSNGAAGDGASGRDGAFGDIAATREGVFVAGAFGDGTAAWRGALEGGIFWGRVAGEEAFVDRPAVDEPARIRSSSFNPV
jgi:hypothetical protein